MYKKKSSINVPAAKKQLPVDKLIKCIFHKWVYAALGTKTQVFAFFVKKSCDLSQAKVSDFFLWKTPKMLTMCFVPNSASTHLNEPILKISPSRCFF